jgi:putative two-component system response regulator
VEEASLKHARILIVDDDPVSLRALEAMLTLDGYVNVIPTTEPGHALGLCASAPPDLLVLDLRMPQIDGFELLRRLDAASLDSPCQVLVLTADDSRATKERALSGGASDFLAKPVDPTEALLRIRNLLRVHFLQLELRSKHRMLARQVSERTEQLTDARVEVLDRLALAAEFRDDATGQHTQRVGRAAALIASRLGLPEDEVSLLRRAAPLHDVGKIGIPDRILLKRGPLTTEERGRMRMHAPIGAAILSEGSSRLLRMGEVIARTHHERWDGVGYPEGLAGEEIPLVGRVTAVADVFDALTHDRPYKGAWPVGEAVEEIRRMSGSQFDPRVVESFAELDPQDLLQPADQPPRARFQRAGLPTAA